MKDILLLPFFLSAFFSNDLFEDHKQQLREDKKINIEINLDFKGWFDKKIEEARSFHFVDYNLLEEELYQQSNRK